MYRYNKLIKNGKECTVQKKYDVAIVGGGPAGSTAAKFLSEKGFKVIIIEKDKIPRYKPCGGGLTKRVLEQFSYVNDKSIIESYSFNGIAHSPSLKNTLSVNYNEPIVGMVLREKLDSLLVKIAVEKGAFLLDGKAVIDYKISDDKVTIFLEGGEKIDSEILIGADGVWSIIAKRSGLRKGPIDRGICILKEFEIDEKIIDKFFTKSRAAHFYTSFQKIHGYGWVFPKKRHINIGIGEFIFKNEKKARINLTSVFKEFIEILKKEKIIPESINVKKCEGGALPINTLKKTFCNRVLLVGDAAGFVCTTSGEGIYYAMKSGEIAAEVISKALDSKNTSEKFLSIYQKKWKKEFGKELKFHYKFRKIRKKGISEKVYKLASKDKVFSEMILNLGIGKIEFHKHKWKLIRRYIVASIKYAFMKSKR